MQLFCHPVVDADVIHVVKVKGMSHGGQCLEGHLCSRIPVLQTGVESSIYWYTVGSPDCSSSIRICHTYQGKQMLVAATWFSQATLCANNASEVLRLGIGVTFF
ncbi:uncharacterized protein AKAW2_40221A [Aspergillus luchuensis]|uniref:Uncharacterized protein n=1 Tax=Aspergillus kawachii TaxID=1069201 RepID=A0A7R7ZXL1_ASPKA|nr:uncharacterized protein AKAW2_40221A [Aspergillus luchuensis]BCR98538.1 hypothetical protein AKAW2_40221A [Aspergillus luchuensis]